MIEYFSLTGLLIEPERHIILCASGSVVEYRLAKARVAGSNPVSRFFDGWNFLDFIGISAFYVLQNAVDSCIHL